MNERDKWIYELGQRHPNLAFDVSDAYIERRGKDKDEIVKLKAQMPQWVSVDERLPERDKNKQFDVMELLFCADGFVFQGEFHYGWMPIPWYVWQDKDGDDYNEQSVTHWMKLPAAPNEAAK